MKGKNQFITNLRGSMENMTAVKAKDGDTIIKGKITQMTNPNSEGQQFNRSRFTQVVGVSKEMGKFWKDTFSRLKPTRSEYNERTADYMDIARTIDPFVLATLIGQMNFTKGNLFPLTPVLNVGGSSDNMDGTWLVSIDWAYDAENLAEEGTDNIFFLLYNPTTGFITSGTNNNTRSDGTEEVTVPIPASGTTYIAIYAKSADGSIWSTQTACAKLTSAGALSAE